MSDPNENAPNAMLNSDPWDMDFGSDEAAETPEAPASNEPEGKEPAPSPDTGEQDPQGGQGEQNNEAASEGEKDAATKKILAKFGEEIYEFPNEAVVTVKVRGKDVEMTVQDALNRASGDYDIQNKYNEFNQVRQKYDSKLKSWEKESGEWQGFTSEILGKINSKDPNRVIEAFDQIIDRMGGDPIMFKNEFVRSLLPLVQKYQGMTDSERALYDRDLEIEKERKIRERETAKLQGQIKAREEQDFNRSVEAAAVEGMQKYGVSEDEFVTAYERAKSLKESGQWSKGADGKPADITPNDVIFIAVEDRVRSQFKDGISSISAAVASDKASYEKYENLLLDRVLFDMTRGTLNSAGYYTEWLKKEIGVSTVAAVKEKVKHSRSNANKPLGKNKPRLRDNEVFDKNLKIQWD